MSPAAQLGEELEMPFEQEGQADVLVNGGAVEVAVHVNLDNGAGRAVGCVGG